MAKLDRSLIARLPQFQGLGDADLDRILAPARSSRYAKESAVFEGLESQSGAAARMRCASSARAMGRHHDFDLHGSIPELSA